jgi:hypothetical protein
MRKDDQRWAVAYNFKRINCTCDWGRLRIGLEKKTQQRQEVPKKYGVELYSFLALSKR